MQTNLFGTPYADQSVWHTLCRPICLAHLMQTNLFTGTCVEVKQLIYVKHIKFLLSKFRQHVSTLYGHLQAFLWNKSLNCCVHLWDPMNAYKGQCGTCADIIRDTMSN
jgi:hypothetical protein